jgi:hypothetical protein
MARFTVRVELHDATWEQYVELHKHMAAEGFTNVIASDDGVRYELPPAEYNFEGNSTKDQVLAKARNAAAKVVRAYAVLVTESAGRTWYGLKKI